MPVNLFSRYGHAMVLLPDGRILVSGGATVDEEYVPRYHQDLRQLDTETMLWSKTKTTGGRALTARLCRVVHIHLQYHR